MLSSADPHCEIAFRAHRVSLHHCTTVRPTCGLPGGGKKAIRPMLPLTLSPFLRTATIQHDNHVITNMSLCPFPSQPLANCVCVCFLLRLHPGLHHTICIPRGEEDGAQAGVAGVGSPLHPSQQWRGVLRPRPQAPRQPPVWHDSQRLLQW